MVEGAGVAPASEEARDGTEGPRRERRGIYAPKLIEAGSKTAIGSGLEQSGMFRTAQGAGPRRLTIRLTITFETRTRQNILRS